MSNSYTIPMKTKNRPNVAENTDGYLIPLEDMDKPNADENPYSEIQMERGKPYGMYGNKHHTMNKGRQQTYKISRAILLVILISICLLVISSLVSLYMIITTWTRIKGIDYAAAGRDGSRELPEEEHWIGLTERHIEGVWTWVDNNENVSFTYWHPGEPNGGLHVYCAAFDLDYAKQWVDFPCSSFMHPIYEKRFEDAVVTAG